MKTCAESVVVDALGQQQRELTDICGAFWLPCVSRTPFLRLENFSTRSPPPHRRMQKLTCPARPLVRWGTGMWSGLCPSGVHQDFVLEKKDVKEMAQEMDSDQASGGRLRFERRWSQWPLFTPRFAVLRGACICSSSIPTGQPGRGTWAMFLSEDPPSWAFGPSWRFSVLPNNLVFLFFLNYLQWLLLFVVTNNSDTSRNDWIWWSIGNEGEREI